MATSPSAYKIVNPSGKSYFHTVSGTPMNDTSVQPRVTGGAIKGTRTQDIASGLVDGFRPGRSGEMAVNAVKDLAHTAKAVSAGTFASNLAGGVIRRVNTTIGGVANTVLLSGGSEYGIRRSIHKVEKIRTYKITTAIRANYWNPTTATFSTPVATSEDIATVGVDQAATPSYAVPGELVYKAPKPLPVQADYEAKTG